MTNRILFKYDFKQIYIIHLVILNSILYGFIAFKQTSIFKFSSWKCGNNLSFLVLIFSGIFFINTRLNIYINCCKITLPMPPYPAWSTVYNYRKQWMQIKGIHHYFLHNLLQLSITILLTEHGRHIILKLEFYSQWLFLF